MPGQVGRELETELSQRRILHLREAEALLEARRHTGPVEGIVHVRLRQQRGVVRILLEPRPSSGAR